MEIVIGAVFAFIAGVVALLTIKRRQDDVVEPVLFDTLPLSTPPEPPQAPVEPVAAPVVPEAPKLSWETPKGAFKLTRIMADELGLTVEQKNILCACIYQESRFRNRYADGSPVINQNKKDGKVWSTDFGIVQVNDYWHIGKGKTFPSVEYVMDNPAKMVEWMAREMKRTGKLQPWSSYVSGAYKKHLAVDSPMWALRS